MGKNKLKKFAEIDKMPFVFQYPRERLLEEGFPHKGKWNDNVFGNKGRIIVELGCGKGEYTVALAKADSEGNYIGVDIKGARIWSGAREIEASGIRNAAFLRTEIENIDNFFSPSEIDEIWITFPDPQMQKTRKRLTSTRFISLYLNILKPGGIIHLKTDSPFLFEYTRRMITSNDFEIISATDDLYGSGLADPVSSIKTFYESQWLSRGKKIKLISFRPELRETFAEPETDDIPRDDYRAYPRHTISPSQPLP
ncbi:MAG: tRNA (guanosine(46)-N7)-methyltransferase TrmB [Muribaculaceae bacterium]|nr:tRNA (guanosine(46)-N7)-methyltransferase TrmB [Muribaculaceae bacterium]